VPESLLTIAVGKEPLTHPGQGDGLGEGIFTVAADVLLDPIDEGIGDLTDRALLVLIQAPSDLLTNGIQVDQGFERRRRAVDRGLIESPETEIGRGQVETDPDQQADAESAQPRHLRQRGQATTWQRVAQRCRDRRHHQSD
jgi:hypothetical protein